MEFTDEELERLNEMLDIAFWSGEVKDDTIANSIYEKVADEISKRSV